MLRIGERGVSRREAEELGVELVDLSSTGEAFTYPGSREMLSGTPAARISSWLSTAIDSTPCARLCQ